MLLSCSLGSVCVCVHVGVAVLSVAAHQDHVWLGYGGSQCRDCWCSSAKASMLCMQTCAGAFLFGPACLLAHLT
jgi:hypothetical protein